MSAAPVQDAAQVGQLLADLKECTLRMFEALQSEADADLLRLAEERQEIIDRFGEMLGDPERGPDRLERLGFSEQIEEIRRAGETLVQRCQSRQAELMALRRQQAVVRNTAKGYRPSTGLPRSTCHFDL